MPSTQWTDISFSEMKNLAYENEDVLLLGSLLWLAWRKGNNINDIPFTFPQPQASSTLP